MKKLMIALIMSVFLITLATAQTYNVTDCATLENEGTYYLQNNITFDYPICFLTNNNNVILDGNGYTIHKQEYEEYSYVIYIDGGYDNITIKNLNFEAIPMSIFYPYTAIDIVGSITGNANNISIENLNIHNYRVAIEIYGSSDIINISNVLIKNVTHTIDNSSVYYNFYEAFLVNWGDNEHITFEDVNLINDNITFYQWFLFNRNANRNINDINYKNLKFENKGVGSITLNNLNFNVEVDEIYVNSTEGIVISQNNATIFTENLNFLNTSATITLENLEFVDYVNILRDGVDCPEDICTLISYEEGTAIFQVTGWSNYSLEQGEAPVVPEDETYDVTSTTTYQYMASSGAGLGKFMLYMAQSLPLLIIGLVFIGIVFVIGIAIAKLVRRVL